MRSRPWTESALWKPLLVLLFLVPLSAVSMEIPVQEEETKSAKAVWSVERVRGEDTVQYEVTIYQIPAPGGHRWVWRAVASDGSFPGGFPIGSMLIQGTGKPRPELFDPLSPGVMEMLLSVHGAGGHENGLGWADGTPVGFRRQIPVERKEVTAADGMITQTGILAGGEIVVRGGVRTLRMTEFTEILHMSAGGSLKSADWVTTLIRGEDDNARTEKRQLKVQRLEAGLIDAQESQEVQSGYEFLAPVVRVLRKGMSLAAVEIAEKMFNEDRKDHEKGPLGDVVKEVAGLLKASKKIASQPLDPDVRARKMIGKPAPAFTLDDIDGNQVTLEDYKGKTLLLAFWGYS